VVLEASRRSFRLSKLGRSTVRTTRVAADTDSGGNYAIRWAWDDYYNTFEVRAGVPVHSASGSELESLVSEDLTRRIEHGSPVVVPFVIQNGDLVRNLHAFVGSLKTQDELTTYERMGKPDKIEKLTFTTHEEATWWYFEAGKTYRFDNGSLLGVSEFEPVIPF